MMKVYRMMAAALALMAGLAFSAQGASALDPERQAIVEALTTAGASINTLQCDFVQIREMKMMEGKMVTYGKMWYSRPSRLRWEYIKPEPGLFVLNGDKALMSNAKGSRQEDASSNKMIKGISSMMLGSISASFLDDARTFATTLSEENGDWVATMIPQRRDMKQMWKSIVIRFDKKTKTAKVIVLNEAGGDRSTIEFSNVILNKDIPEEVFSVNR